MEPAMAPSSPSQPLGLPGGVVQAAKRRVGFAEIFLVLFLGAVYFIPDSVTYFGPFRGKNPFFVIFALTGIHYAVSSLLGTGGSGLPVKSSHVVFLVFLFLYAFPLAIIWTYVAGSYSLARFLFGFGSFVASTMLLYVFMADRHPPLNFAFLQNVLIICGVVVALVIFTESFLLDGQSLYQNLFGYNPILAANPDSRWTPGYFTRHYGSLTMIRATGPFRNPLVAGFFLLFPLGMAMAKFGPELKGRLFWLICAGLIMVGMACTVSVSIGASSVVMLMVYAKLYTTYVAKSSTMAQLVKAAIVGLFIYLVAFTPLRAIPLAILDYFGDTGYYLNTNVSTDRIDYIAKALSVWWERPLLPMLLGSGFGQIMYDGLTFKHSMNLLDDFGIYLAMLLEVGIVGLTLFVAFFVCELRDTLKSIRQSRSMEFVCFNIGYFSLIVALMVELIFYNYYPNLYMLAFVLGIKAAAERKYASAPADSPAQEEEPDSVLPGASA